MTTFEAALEQAKRERVPVMALRPDHRFPEELDDVVVENVSCFRAEAMDDDVWWMCCYFPNGERVTFHVGIDKKPKRIHMSVTEYPVQWRDWDEMRREAAASEETGRREAADGR